MQGEVELEERGPSGHMYIKIMIHFLSKIYLFTHVYFIQKYKIENTFRITFQIPVLSLGITYKLQHVFVACGIGWSEKHKSGKMQKYQADSKLRHSTDFRTIFGIMIG